MSTASAAATTTPDNAPPQETGPDGAAARGQDNRRSSREENRPIGGYRALMTAFAAAGVGLGLLARRKNRVPNGLGPGDLALASVATFRMSRLITRDSVTSAVRAPFTEFEKRLPRSEVLEKPVGRGVRKAVGELLTCPFCASVWVATGFTYGFVLAPRATRLAAGALTAVAVSDALQYSEQILQRAAE